MDITGKVHCFFEQSGTFKNEFIKLGIPVEDYDIQNNFGETDHVVDLFAAIEDAYDGRPSLFDNIGPNDLIMAFFPCIYFCDAKTLYLQGLNIGSQKWSMEQKADRAMHEATMRQNFYIKLWQLVAVVSRLGLRCVIENPWNTNGQSFLQLNFIRPTIIDKNRMLRGDYFVKPTAYWFIGCNNTIGNSWQKDKERKIVNRQPRHDAGICGEERSLISPDYARNFICDFVIGKVQTFTQQTLF